MNYNEVKIITSEGGLEAITGLLLSLEINETIINSGSTAIDILDKKDSYEWDYVNPDIFTDEEVNADSVAEILFYLECTKEGEDLYNRVLSEIENLKKSGEKWLSNTEISKSIVEDTDWINEYKNTLKPVYIGDNIVVRPTWCNPVSIKEDTIEIVMDPGMAFGTGDHPTTSMCAEFLIEENCKDKVVLDVGTGSGILGILAYKLGAKETVGVDIDSIAVEVAKENADLNGCDNSVSFIEGDLTKGLNIKADIVVGNLMA